MDDDISYHDCFVELESGNHGHFAKALAKAWFVADSGNRRLIEKTWCDLVVKARSFVEDEKQRQWNDRFDAKAPACHMTGTFLNDGEERA